MFYSNVRAATLRVRCTTRRLTAASDLGNQKLSLVRSPAGRVGHSWSTEAAYHDAFNKQEGLEMAPTKKGELACPNHGGGIQWNGGAYDPVSNIFIVPSTNECAIFKITTYRPPYIPGP
jgi:hypothetical protein